MSNLGLLKDRIVYGKDSVTYQNLRQIKTLARIACADEDIKLRNCIKNSWFGRCSEESEEFQTCYQSYMEKLKLVLEKNEKLKIQDIQ
ncbi:hypothetical protein TrispH2_007851 [Trichoplax sp. H2]|nr:hypothetical protein TrispH2_007851 [Trichoplax sp. H2]|eukprot:RDD39437.1 hypothetical protein TrispH2_007851 [Trichoplax sp. H2]